MSRNEPQGPWASALRRANLVDPRHGRPSWSALARAVGRHTSTITAMVRGERKTEYEAIKAVAEALRVSPQDVADWIAIEQYDPSKYELPRDDFDERWEQVKQSALYEALKSLGAVDEYPESVEEATRDLLGLFSDEALLREFERRLKNVRVESGEDAQVVDIPDWANQDIAARSDSRTSRTAREARMQRDRIGEESQDQEGFDPA